MIHSELFTFQSGDFRLTASIDLPAAMGAAGSVQKVPAVIFCHGFTGHRIESRRMYARLAARLARSGVGCFRFDHRGCGESDGDFVDFTAHGMLEDLDAAFEKFWRFDWVDKTRSAVVGYSLGGTSASYLMQKNPEFKTAVLWAPVAAPGIIRERLSLSEGFDRYFEQGYVDYGGFRVSKGFLEHAANELTPLQWASAFPGPILYCHGKSDDVVKLSHSESYMAVRKNALDQRVLIDNADHGFTTPDNIDRVLEESHAWLVEKLQP